MEVGGSSNKLGGGGWSWVEVGVRFSNTRIRKEQIGEEDKTIFNSADFQKFSIKDWPTCT